jgi:peptidoglycan/xylan/chitin deacetylase (PgdA/CDA1 family)
MSSRRAARLAAAALLGALAGFPVAAAQAPRQEIALTFDDLPSLSLSDSTAYWRRTNADLVHGLRARRMAATGFVIGDKLEGPQSAERTAMLAAWRDAGLELGNHTYSHLSLNKTPVDSYIADVQRDDAVLRPLLAVRREAPRWFRYPYLETGVTLEDKRRFEAWLAADRYRVAPVTVENSDWEFALPYDEAVMHRDWLEARRIRQAYLAYTEQALDWYRKAAADLLGRPPALVFLLHDSRLNADSLGALSALLRRSGMRVVSLDRAMADPAYRISDDHLDPDGDEWLSRWSVTLQKDLPWDDFPEPPADIAAANARLDKEP